MRPLVVAERKSQHDADGESAYAAESLLVRAAAQRRVEADDAHIAPAAEVTDGMVPHGTGRSGLRATAPCPRGSSSLSPTEPASRRTLGHLGGPRPVLPRRLEHKTLPPRIRQREATLAAVAPAPATAEPVGPGDQVHRTRCTALQAAARGRRPIATAPTASMKITPRTRRAGTQNNAILNPSSRALRGSRERMAPRMTCRRGCRRRE